MASRYECDECGESFNYWSSAKDHVLEEHVEPAEYIRDVWGGA